MVNEQIADLNIRASELASRIPALLVKARTVSHTVIQGIHGRKRSGPGETFWQFRKYQVGDLAQHIDWRKSASSDSLFVREKEWEAAHTVWIWPNLSHSMMYKSDLSHYSKAERTLVLMFALTNILSRGGEQVGLLGLNKPRSGRNVSEKLSEFLASYLLRADDIEGSPPAHPVHALSECVILTDGLEPVDLLIDRVKHIAKNGARGHVIQILDPIEEVFPFTGHTQFHDFMENTQFVIKKAQDIRNSLS